MLAPAALVTPGQVGLHMMALVVQHLAGRVGLATPVPVARDTMDREARHTKGLGAPSIEAQEAPLTMDPAVQHILAPEALALPGRVALAIRVPVELAVVVLLYADDGISNIMSRVTLSPTLPQQTAAFKRFEQTNVDLNRFYWTFKCSLDHILPYMAAVKSVPELIKGASGNHLNISSDQFVTEAPQTQRVARHSILVLAVTAFEDYVKEILTTFLIKNWKHDKTYKVSFRPQDLPEIGRAHV